MRYVRTGIFHEDWSNFGSAKLRLVVDTVWSRKNIWCSLEKEPQMSQEDKDNLLNVLDEEELEIGGKLIDVINSPIFHGSVNAARKLCKYLSLGDQVKADLNTGLLSMVLQLHKQALTPSALTPPPVLLKKGPTA